MVCRSVRDLCGFAEEVIFQQDGVSVDASLHWLHHGEMLAAWIGYKLTRGTAAVSLINAIIHVRGLLEYFYEPGQPEAQRALDVLESQLRGVAKQIKAAEPARQRPVPDELRAANRWCAWDSFQRGARLQARLVLTELGALAESRRRARQDAITLRSGARLVLPAMGEALATRLADAWLACFMAELPPHRARLLRSLVLVGCEGLPAVTITCPECPHNKSATCPGNILVRRGPHSYSLLISHHKNNKERIGPIPMSTASGASSEWLEVRFSDPARSSPLVVLDSGAGWPESGRHSRGGEGHGVDARRLTTPCRERRAWAAVSSVFFPAPHVKCREGLSPWRVPGDGGAVPPRPARDGGGHARGGRAGLTCLPHRPRRQPGRQLL